MSGEEWVTSNQAVTMLRKAKIEDNTTLAIWAEKRLLRSRAATVTRDGEPDGFMDGFASTPAIAADFWYYIRFGSRPYTNWGAGIFAATINETPEAGHNSDYYRWELTDVTFHAGELTKLIARAQPETEAGGPPNGGAPCARWQKQRVSDSQEDLFKFFGFAGKHLPGGSHVLNLSALRGRYVEWHKKENRWPRPLKRSAFEKWLERHKDGWRNESRRWKLSQ